MTKIRVYVAAPFEYAPSVRRIHERLRALDFTPTSTWCESEYATGESERPPTEKEARTALAENDSMLLSSHALICISKFSQGGEMFCEFMQFYLRTVCPIVWVGPRKILSVYRHEVVYVEDVDSAFAHLINLRARGDLVA